MNVLPGPPTGLTRTAAPGRFGPVPVHPALDRLRSVIEATIAPAAVATDASAVPASHLAALAGTGFFGLTVPAAHGGLDAPEEVVTEAHELLAGACPSTFLVASQHGAPIRSIVDNGGPELRALLPALARGERIGGVAFGHVRSWPARRTLVARRAGRGWRFDGVVPWFSGAGLVDLVNLAAVAEAESTIVFAEVDLPRPGEVEDVPLDLVAVRGSRTVALRIDGLTVPDERVTRVVDVDAWKAEDGRGVPGPAPGALGLARAALAYALDRQPDHPDLLALADEVAAARRPPAGADPVRWRAYSVNLAVRATNAAVVARGGAALLTGDPAQIWARAALFLEVRALSPELRDAHLRQLAGG